MTAPVDVSAGVLTRDGLVLACQRRLDQLHPGKWEFPGGKRETGESAADCLRRELEEELGIQADIGAELWRTEHAYPGRAAVRLQFFAVPSYRGALENRAFATIRWAPPSELAELDFLDADRELIALLAGGAIPL